MSQFLRQLLRCFERAIGDDEALTIFLRALHRNRARAAAGPENEDAKIPQIYRELFADGSGKTSAIRVEPMKIPLLNLDNVYGADTFRFRIDLVDQRQRLDLVRHG